MMIEILFQLIKACCRGTAMASKNSFLKASFIISFLFVQATCFAHSKDTLAASSLHPLGRYAWTPEGNLELISSGVHFGFSFSGTECKIFTALSDPRAHSYLQYTLDGIYQKRIRISGNQFQPIVLNGLSKGSHALWIYKATEAATGPIFIQKIIGEIYSP